MLLYDPQCAELSRKCPGNLENDFKKVETLLDIGFCFDHTVTFHLCRKSLFLWDAVRPKLSLYNSRSYRCSSDPPAARLKPCLL